MDKAKGLSFLRKAGLCGSSDRVRTCGLMVPNSSPNFFPLIYSDIPSFLLGFAYSLALFETLFPRVPRLSVVIYVVKNASRPRPAACRRAPNGKHFFVSDRLDCNSEGRVMQEVSDGTGDADFAGQWTKKQAGPAALRIERCLPATLNKIHGRSNPVVSAEHRLVPPADYFA